MPIELHAGARAHLTTKLAEALRSVRVKDNRFLAYDSIHAIAELDAVLPSHGKSARKALEAYVGEDPVSTFVLSELATKLESREHIPGSDDVFLIDLPEYSDPTAVADTLVASLETLPWQYTCLIALPEALGGLVGNEVYEQPLSDRFSFLRVTPDGSGFPLNQEASIPGLFTLFGVDPKPNGVVPGTTYIKGQVDGYVPLYGTSATVEDFVLTARAILGLLISFRTIELDKTSLGAASRQYTLVFRKEGGGLTPHDPLELSREMSAALKAPVTDRVLEKHGPAFVTAVTRDAVKKIGIVLRADDSTDRLMRAAAWLFDSEASINQHLSFVQATVAIEILFGEKATSDIIGLGELLANRCAYLIGKTRTQRDKVITDFRRVYATRSRIVHSGQLRLSNQERADLQALQWMATRAIQEEVELLEADLKKK